MRVCQLPRLKKRSAVAFAHEYSMERNLFWAEFRASDTAYFVLMLVVIMFGFVMFCHVSFGPQLAR